MTRRAAGGPRALAATTAGLTGLLLVAALGGCATDAELTGAEVASGHPGHRHHHGHHRTGRATGSAAHRGDGAASSADSAALPPGDPGTDAPAAADPGRPQHSHAAAPKPTVPATAMLDASSVGSMIGGAWQPVTARADHCFASEQALDSRTVGFTGARGTVTETVATYPSTTAAEEAYTAVVTGLGHCGWSTGEDPRLGAASMSAARRGTRATYVVGEGVTLVVTGTGSAASRVNPWSFLVDLALGSTCPAAPDGCH